MHKEKHSSKLVSERRVRWLLTLVLAGLAILAISFFYEGGEGERTANDADTVPIIIIENPRIVRPLAEGRPAAGYLAIRNDGDGPARLMGAEGAGGVAADIHESVQEDGRSSMRAVTDLTIPAGGEIVFERGGLHLMVRGADYSGDQIRLNLIFERADAVPVDFRIVTLNEDG